MLLRHGKVIAEGWWQPYSAKKVHLLYSLSKSFTATAIGLAVDEGRLSVDDQVIAFFPDDLPPHIGDHLAAMRIHHLLSMATGHSQDTLDPMLEAGDNWVRTFLSLPPEQAPGSIFFYNNGASFMLSAIIHKVTGQNLLDYLRPRLLEPLGITEARWDENPQGISQGFSGLHISTESIARFGQFYLQGGKWQGQQLLSRQWIEMASRWHIACASPGEESTADWEQGYGYQFWLCQHQAYRGDGAFGQFCVIMPQQDTVLAITAAVDRMQSILDAAWSQLLPAMHSEALAEAPAEHSSLVNQLANLAIPPVQGQTTSAIAQAVSGVSYYFDSELQSQGRFTEIIETISLQFQETTCLLNLQTSQANHQLSCSYQRWTSATTALYGYPASSISASAAWTNSQTFSCQIIYEETPHSLHLDFQFEGDKLMLTRRWNVSFEALEPAQLIGKANNQAPSVLP